MLVYKNGAIVKSEVRRPSDDEIAFIYRANPSDDEIQHIVGDVFECHPLVVQNCTSRGQRPTIDMYDDYFYMSFYALKDEWDLYEMSIVAGKNFVIAILPEEEPLIANLKDILLRSPNRMKSTGMLLYELLHSCVLGYSELVDTIDDFVNKSENQLYKNPHAKLAAKIFKMKRKLHKVRRIFTEERELVNSLMHARFFQEEDVRYLADIYQHAGQVVEMVDTFRDSLTGLIELQMSIKGDKMNEIMKTLTIVNTVFLPMMFIVGLYGTNIHLPIYGWTKNYLWLWGWLLFSSIFMIVYFKRKKWM
ncbi:magnesium transporter CorA family protein [Alicyclobacillus mengziensis]|uniref:Magnesium transporter CorA family protein n=1 Tax=Alicyclobacillus mengziensis TaxID=2931921 RepID=A0A9X7VYI9_9BACL|nr:magnesium transporter CorA family protein [Alicyclobacillus mengziensis]QSO47428.1 magnesium transporter CorA family protein [Alicyclobacillus mengziensis]